MRVAAGAAILAASTVVGFASVAGAATVSGVNAGSSTPALVTATSRPQPGPGDGWMGGAGRRGGRGIGERGAGPGAGGSQYDIPAAVPGATISAEVAAELQYLVAEEKLARDVYTLAAGSYSDRPFTNIKAAEGQHMAEIALMLTRYGITDPTTGDAAGRFDNADLQALYDKLAEQVRSGRTQAYQAGVIIEQTDMADLDKALAMAPPADVTAILNNLKAGSQRHLVAFQRWA